MDDDGIHKFAYGHDVLFADLLRLVSPALAAELDFTRAELLPTALVSAGETRLKEPSAGAARGEWSARGHPRMKQRHGDMMWRVPRRPDAIDDATAAGAVSWGQNRLRPSVRRLEWRANGKERKGSRWAGRKSGQEVFGQAGQFVA